MPLCTDRYLGSHDPSPIVFAHQSKWQQRILHLCGCDMCITDSTYNTTVYDLPLLILCVLTNVSSVASLLICDKQQESTAAALKATADWNPDWKPNRVMNKGQIAAVASTFPGNSLELACDLMTWLCNITMLCAGPGRLMCLFVWLMSPHLIH